MQGNILVDTLILERSAIVCGNIICKHAEIEEGASLVGSLCLSTNENDIKELQVVLMFIPM